MLSEKVKIKNAYIDSVVYPRGRDIRGKWSVTRWISEDIGEFTAVGFCPLSPLDSTAYNLTGTWIEHEKYGTQLKLSTMEIAIDMTNNEEVAAYLTIALTPREAELILKAYPKPAALFQLPEDEILKKLCAIKGIGRATAGKVIDKFANNLDKGGMYATFLQLGFTKKMVMALQKAYGSLTSAYARLSQDPYDAVGKAQGVGFRKADEIALKFGFEPVSPVRISGFIRCILRESALTGRSWETRAEIVAAVYDTFGGRENVVQYDEKSVSNIDKAFSILMERDEIRICKDPTTGVSRVCLTQYRTLEMAVANELRRIQHASNPWQDISRAEIEERLRGLEEEQGWEFTPDQKDGIELAVHNQLCLITGSAGTGKSTLVAGLLKVLEGVDFVQTALSGKAAARLQNVTGETGQTIHRLLQIRFDGGKPQFNARKQLTTDLVILDEISLLGGDIFLKLLRAIPNGAKLVILGDMHQLEAIGTMNIAHDLYVSDSVPTVRLTEILRQAEHSGIITLAEDVRHSANPFTGCFEGDYVLGDLQDMHVVLRDKRSEIPDAFVTEYDKWFHSDAVKEDPSRLHVLAPIRDRGNMSAFQLNNLAQEIANPAGLLDPKRREFLWDKQSWILTVGDKVMCLKNNYKAIEDETEDLTTIFNGWTGQVLSMDKDFCRVKFDEEEKIIRISYASIAKKQLGLGYASTVHKFQGSSAPVIIGVLDNLTPPMMRTGELLYTMLTRAEEQCVLVAQRDTLDASIASCAISSKQTFLHELLEARR